MPAPGRSDDALDLLRLLALLSSPIWAEWDTERVAHASCLGLLLHDKLREHVDG